MEKKKIEGFHIEITAGPYTENDDYLFIEPVYRSCVEVTVRDFGDGFPSGEAAIEEVLYQTRCALGMIILEEGVNRGEDS